MPDKREPKYDSQGRLEYETFNGNPNDRITYKWNEKWQLESVTLRSGKIISYTYHEKGGMFSNPTHHRLKSRTVKASANDPGVTEAYTNSGFPSGNFTVRVNGKVTESYRFTEAELKSFAINNRFYTIKRTAHKTDMGDRNTLNLLFENISPSQTRFEQAYVYDRHGKVFVIIDEFSSPSDDKVIPKFMFLSQYYDKDTELYYLHNKTWYHPEFGKTLYGRSPSFLPHPSHLRTRNERYVLFNGVGRPTLDAISENFENSVMDPNYGNKLTEELLGLMAMPEEIGSRVSGAGRIFAGAMVFFVSIPADITVVGAVVGVPMAIWAGDQIGTGIVEIHKGKYQDSMGGRLAKEILGNGMRGNVAGGAYDFIPMIIPNAPALAVRLTTAAPRSVALAPRASAAIHEAFAAARAPHLARTSRAMPNFNLGTKPLGVGSPTVQFAAPLGDGVHILQAYRSGQQARTVLHSSRGVNSLSKLNAEMSHNVAGIHGFIDGARVPPRFSVSSAVETTVPKGFVTGIEPTTASLRTFVGGRFHWRHTEWKLLEEILQATKLNPATKGRLWLFTERFACAHCTSAILKFRKLRINIRLEVLSGGTLDSTGYWMDTIRKATKF